MFKYTQHTYGVMLSKRICSDTIVNDLFHNSHTIIPHVKALELKSIKIMNTIPRSSSYHYHVFEIVYFDSV